MSIGYANICSSVQDHRQNFISLKGSERTKESKRINKKEVWSVLRMVFLKYKVLGVFLLSLLLCFYPLHIKYLITNSEANSLLLLNCDISRRNEEKVNTIQPPFLCFSHIQKNIALLYTLNTRFFLSPSSTTM